MKRLTCALGGSPYTNKPARFNRLVMCMVCKQTRRPIDTKCAMPPATFATTIGRGRGRLARQSCQVSPRVRTTGRSSRPRRNTSTTSSKMLLTYVNASIAVCTVTGVTNLATACNLTSTKPNKSFARVRCEAAFRVCAWCSLVGSLPMATKC